MSRRKYALSVAIILSMAFLVRASVCSWWQSRLSARSEVFAMGDSDSYWYLAQQIATGAPYHYHTADAAVFRAPGYPALLSFFASSPPTSSAVLKARLMGAVLGTLSVALMIHIAYVCSSRYWSASREESTHQIHERAGITSLIAGALVSLYPGSIAMSTLVLSEAPFQPLMLGALGCWAREAMVTEQGPRSVLNRRTCWTIGGGLLSGVAVLVRPSWLLFPPFFFGIKFIFGKERARTFLSASLAGASMALIMSPWWYRNFQVTGHFVPTTLQVGASLFDGLRPGATGASDTGMLFTVEVADAIRAEDQLAVTEAMDNEQAPPRTESLEYRVNQRLATRAVQWAFAHPTDVMRLAVVKTFRTWAIWPSNDSSPGGNAMKLTLALGMLGVAIPACIFTARVVIRPTTSQKKLLWAWMPFVMPVLYFSLLHAVFVGSIRYRQPALVALCLISAMQYGIWTHRIFTPATKGLEAGHATG